MDSLVEIKLGFASIVCRVSNRLQNTGSKIAITEKWYEVKSMCSLYWSLFVYVTFYIKVDRPKICMTLVGNEFEHETLFRKIYNPGL